MRDELIVNQVLATPLLRTRAPFADLSARPDAGAAARRRAGAGEAIPRGRVSAAEGRG